MALKFKWFYLNSEEEEKKTQNWIKKKKKNTKMADILSVQVTVRLIESSGLRNRWGGNLIQPRALLTFL